VDRNGNVISWSPLTDEFPGPHIMGSFLVHGRDSRHILIGPGDFSGNGDGRIYRTDTEGVRWNLYELPVGRMEKSVATVWRIVDDRSDSSGNTVLAATDRGIYRSLDFGAHWHRVFRKLPGGQTLNVMDIVQDAAAPGTWYAAARTPHSILRSTNSGKKDTWEAFFGTAKIHGSVQRVSLSACESDPRVLFALVTARGGALNGLYRTLDHGNTWANIFARSHNAVINSGNQGAHTGALACDPTNPDHVIFGVQQALETFNATAPPASISWRGCPQGTCQQEESTLDPGHGDFNFFFFRPHHDSIVACSDGGYYIYHPDTQTVDDSGNLLGIDANFMRVDQGGLAASRSEPNVFVGGLEDNGVVIGDTLANTLRLGIFCDGGQGSVMPDNPNLLAVSTTGDTGRFESIDRGQDWISINHGLEGINFSSVQIDPTPNLDAPLIFTPAKGPVGATRVLYRSAADLFSDWQLASPVTFAHDITHLDHTTNETFHTLVVTRQDQRSLFAYSGFRFELGELHVVDLHVPLSPLSNGVRDGRANADKSVLQPNTIYYTTGASRPSQALFTDDLGQTWHDLGASGDLSTVAGNGDFNKLIGNPRDPRQFFLATSKGVFRTDDAGESWHAYSEGLRLNEDVTDIVINIHGLDRPTLYIGTNGRGFWQRVVE